MAQGANTNGQSQPVYFTDATGAAAGTAANPTASYVASGSTVGDGYSAVNFLFDSAGNQRPLYTAQGVFASNGNVDRQRSVSFANGGTGQGVVAVGPVVFNGATYDQQRKPNGFARVASSAASGNPAVAKASAGDLATFFGQNGGTATFLQIYNKASTPVIGTDTPVLTFPIPASAVFSAPGGLTGMYFSTGIAYAFTTDAAGTTGAAAAAVTAFGLAYA